MVDTKSAVAVAEKNPELSEMSGVTRAVVVDQE